MNTIVPKIVSTKAKEAYISTSILFFRNDLDKLVRLAYGKKSEINLCSSKPKVTSVNYKRSVTLDDII